MFQVVPEVGIAGKVFSNLTLRTQNVSTPFQSLLNGMSYFVSVRATNNGAQRLTAIITSAAVKVPALTFCRQGVAYAGCQHRLQVDVSCILLSCSCWYLQVDQTAPMMENQGHVYNSLDCKTSLTQTDTIKFW